jgi:hypothetical protein
MHQFTKFNPAWNSTCFGQFLCPTSRVYSLYTRHWYRSPRFVDSFRAGPWCRVPCRIRFGKLVRLLVSIIKKFVTMRGHVNVKYSLLFCKRVAGAMPTTLPGKVKFKGDTIWDELPLTMILPHLCAKQHGDAFLRTETQHLLRSTVLMLTSFWTKERLNMDIKSVSENPNRQDFVVFRCEKLKVL